MSRDEFIAEIKRTREDCGSDKNTIYTMLNLMKEAGIDKTMLDQMCIDFNKQREAKE